MPLMSLIAEMHKLEEENDKTFAIAEEQHIYNNKRFQINSQGMPNKKRIFTKPN